MTDSLEAKKARPRLSVKELISRYPNLAERYERLKSLKETRVSIHNICSEGLIRKALIELNPKDYKRLAEANKFEAQVKVRYKKRIRF